MKIKIADVISMVCHYYGIPKSQLISTTRRRPIAHTRQVAVMLARECTSASLPKLSQAFGHKDHTTALYSILIVKERCKNDSGYAATVETLRKRLHSGMAVEHEGPIEFWWGWCGDTRPKPQAKPSIPVLRPDQLFLPVGMSRAEAAAEACAW